MERSISICVACLLQGIDWIDIVEMTLTDVNEIIDVANIGATDRG